MDKKYGLLFDEPSEKDYVFGGGKIPQEVINPSRDWRPYVGTPEYQDALGIETYACVCYTILNCVEMLLMAKLEKGEFSEEDIERYLKNGFLKKRL